MKSTKIRRMGDELVVAVPQEMLSALGLGEGDEVIATATDRCIQVAAVDPELERQLDLARRGMKKYRNTLSELAK